MGKCLLEKNSESDCVCHAFLLKMEGYEFADLMKTLKSLSDQTIPSGKLNMLIWRDEK